MTWYYVPSISAPVTEGSSLPSDDMPAPWGSEMPERTGNMEHLLALAAVETDDCVLWDRGRKGEYGTVRAGRTAHREVCWYYHGAPPAPEAHAAHSCGVPLCVNPRHLRWATPAENIADKAKHGTNLRGEQHNMAKLSACQVTAIRLSTKSLAVLARQFGISKSQVHRIRTGENWGEL